MSQPLRKIIVHGEQDCDRELLAFVFRTRCPWQVTETTSRGELDRTLYEHRWNVEENDVRLVVVIHEGRLHGDISATNRTLRMLKLRHPSVPVLLLDLPRVMGQSELVGARLAGVREMPEILDTAWPLVVRKRGPKAQGSIRSKACA